MVPPCGEGVKLHTLSTSLTDDLKLTTLFTSWLLLFVCRLRIAFKWIVRAFSGYLSTDQLLLLWDRILGYDSLEIVAGTH